MTLGMISFCSPEELLLHAVLKSEVRVQSHVKVSLLAVEKFCCCCCCGGSEDVSVDICVAAPHLCRSSCAVAASQPIGGLGARDNWG